MDDNKDKHLFEIIAHLYDTQRNLEAMTIHIDRLEKEVEDLKARRELLRAQRDECGKVLAGFYAGNPSAATTGVLGEGDDVRNDSQASVFNVDGRLKPTNRPMSVTGSKKAPFKSREDVKGLARTVLDILDRDPTAIWKSYDLISEVLERESGRNLQRNTVSSAIYRLSLSGLVKKVGEGLLTSALPTESPSSEPKE